MQQIFRLSGTLSSPAILIVAVWCAALIGVAIGPIDYPMQPSPVVFALVAAGVSLFVLAHWAGAWSFDNWAKGRAKMPAPSIATVNRIVVATSLIGIAGIGLIALDRTVLSGVSGYSELLRCAPGLVDFIEIKRTPLLYVGYLTFSFGFASLVLFVLKGEEIRGWAATLGQLSILSPVGYALLYSGRMPILFMIVLIIAAMLVRIGQGRRPLPRGHHVLLKMAIVVLLFGIYSNSIWSRRQSYCTQMTGLINELQQRQKNRNVRQTELGQNPATARTDRSQPADAVTASDLSKMVDKTQAPPDGGPPNSWADRLLMMKEAWDVKPRAYVTSMIDSGHLSPSAAMTALSTYFYLSHGIRVIDITWHAREKFSPHWGLYEVGILSPILRVFFPQSQQVADLEAQLRSAQIFGFFPTAWVAAFIDFGAMGSIVYILIWGFAAGWSAAGSRHSNLAMPLLLLAFILSTILLSPIQGPLGVANSALALVSMVVVGMVIDLANARSLGGLLIGAPPDQAVDQPRSRSS
jgi:hypothetical protein